MTGRVGILARRGDTLLAWVAVVAFALQLLVSAAAMAAPLAGGLEQAYAQGCATPNGDADGAPVAPASHHKHGACCFLHGGAIAAPSFCASIGLRLSPPAKHAFALQGKSAEPLGPAPELGPLAPRAPPSL